jgi:hypothetical protein
MVNAMARFGFSLGIAILGLLGTGCESSTAPASAINGRWKSDSTFIVLDGIEVSLTQRDTIIEGSGRYLRSPETKIAVIGFESSLMTPDPIVLTFAAVNTFPALFKGHLSDNGDTLRGEFRFLLGSIPPDTFAFLRQ